MKKIENPYKYKIRICFIGFRFSFRCFFVVPFLFAGDAGFEVKKSQRKSETGTVSFLRPEVRFTIGTVEP